MEQEIKNKARGILEGWDRYEAEGCLKEILIEFLNEICK